MITISRKRYWTFMELCSIILIIAGFFLSQNQQDFFNPTAWFGSIIILYGIISYIVASDEKEKSKC